MQRVEHGTREPIECSTPSAQTREPAERHTPSAATRKPAKCSAFHAATREPETALAPPVRSARWGIRPEAAHVNESARLREFRIRARNGRVPPSGAANPDGKRRPAPCDGHLRRYRRGQQRRDRATRDEIARAAELSARTAIGVQ